MSEDSPQRITPATSMALLYLRALVAPIPKAGADLLGLAEKLLRRYEVGSQSLSRERCEELAGRLGHPPEAVDILVFAHELVAPPPPAEADSPVALSSGERGRILRTVMTFAWTLVRELYKALVRKRKQEKADAAHHDAADLWARLKTAPRAEWRQLVLTFPEYRRWALAMKGCHESVRAAAHSAKEALDLARFALYIAERILRPESFRVALQGYCWLFIGNAHRVGNDFAGADADFTRAAELRQQGADPDGLLPAWRWYDLEASLRREQHRFPEALDLLDRALRARDTDRIVASRILLNKSHVLERMGDFGGALATLEEAAPAIEAAHDERLLFALRFDTIANLVQLERYAEAAGLLPGARKLAEQQRSQLSLNRLVWLEAKTMAGLEQKQEAMERLAQVQRAFTREELPYDAALAGLDLALLWLEAGRTRDVQRLAAAMEWIFRHQGIEREALAALKLFCDAARQGIATEDLTRQVSVEIERVRRSAPRPVPAAGGRG